MAGRMRDAKIGLHFDVDYTDLNKANQAVDDTIKKASKTEGSFKKTSSGIDSASSSLKKSAREIDQNTDKVDKFGNSAKRNFDKTENGAKGASRGMKTIGTSAKESQSKVSSLAEKSEKASDRMKKGFMVAKVAVAAIGAAAIKAGKEMFEMASNYDEAVNKVDTAFGKNSQILKDWSQTTRKEIGLSRGTALDLAAGYGDMATSMGLNTKESAKMSESMVNLAADLSSFKNRDIESINTALNGVFTGETESLKGLGIVMTQTNLKQYAMDKGLIKNAQSSAEATAKSIALEKAQKAVNDAVAKYGAGSLEARDAQSKLALATEKAGKSSGDFMKNMTQDEKVRLRYNYVMDMTKNAHGDFKKTSDQAANATRVFTESTKELGDKMGHYLLPIFTPLIVKATDFVEQGDEIPGMINRAKETFQPFADEGAKYFGQVKEYFTEELIPSAKEFAKNFGAGFGKGTLDGLKTFAWVISHTVMPPLEWLRKYADKYPNRMKTLGKWTGFGITAMMGFSLLSAPIFKITAKIDKMRHAIEKVGDSAIVSAGKAKLGFDVMEQNAPTGSPTPVPETPVMKTSKLSNLKKLSGWMFKGSAAAEMTEGAQSIANEKALLASAGIAQGGKTAGLLGKAATGAKAAPGLSWITALLNLKGTNAKNIGDKVGGSLGSIIGGVAGTKAATAIGAKLGATAGTVFGPVGTAVGGILGTGIGLAAGGAIGKGLQKGWPKVEKKLGKLWEASKENFFAAPIVLNIEATVKSGKKAVKGAKESYKWLKDDPLNPDVTKGASKKTKKKLNDYLALFDENDYQSAEMGATGQARTKKQLEKELKNYDKMREQVVNSLNSKSKHSAKNLDSLYSQGLISKDSMESGKRTAKETADVRTRMYDKSNNEIKNLEKKRNADIIKQTQVYENRINSIKQRASKEHRSLTKSEMKEIQSAEKLKSKVGIAINSDYEKKRKRINKKMKRDAVVSMSSSAKEQKIILGNLANSSGKLSAKQAASVVKHSKKAKDKTVKNANEKYKKIKHKLDEEYYANGTITKKQYEEGVKNAQNQRDGQIDAAEESHKEVVKQAKKQAKGHVKQIDWETGTTLSNWEIFKGDFSKKTGEIKDAVLKKWGEFKGGVAGVFNKIVSGINHIWKWLGGKELGGWKESGKSGKAYAAGKRDTYAGPALVGEEGAELAYDKQNSSMRLLGSNGPEITHVRASESILPHKQTRSVLNGGLGTGTVLPGFDKGKGLTEKAKDKVSDIVDGAKEVTKSISGWLEHPIDKIKSLFTKNNKYNKDKSIDRVGWRSLTSTAGLAKEWAKTKLQSLIDDYGAVSGSGSRGEFIKLVLAQKDKQYVWGAEGPNTFDCSGLIMWALGKLGISFPHYTGAQWKATQHISEKEAQPGDLIYFGPGASRHVGMYTKKGQMFNASAPNAYGPGKGIGYSSYRAPDLLGFARIKQLSNKGGSAGSGPKAVGGHKNWMKQAGFSPSEYAAINYIVSRESGWNYRATNPGSGAYGLPQSLPGSKMASAGGDWRSNPITQLRWMRSYVKSRYGGANGAYAFWQRNHWYAKGGRPTKGETALVGEKGPELFEPDTAGTIHPFEKTKSLFSNAKGGIDFHPTININIENGEDSKVTGNVKKAVQKAMDEMLIQLQGLLGGGAV